MSQIYYTHFPKLGVIFSKLLTQLTKPHTQYATNLRSPPISVFQNTVLHTEKVPFSFPVLECTKYKMVFLEKGSVQQTDFQMSTHECFMMRGVYSTVTKTFYSTVYYQHFKVFSMETHNAKGFIIGYVRDRGGHPMFWDVGDWSWW